ncbi:sortase [Candidatus Saccharibacteria bacterium]|nr:sortase [Candidatus Saccharibacteria bacterium]
MPHGPLKLDNPAFAGTLRYKSRSVSYSSRTMHPRTIQDIAGVRHQHGMQDVARQHRGATMDIAPPPTKQRRTAAVRGHHNATGQPAVQTQQEKRPKRSLRSLSRRTAMLYAAAVFIFGFGVYVGVTGMLANRQVTAQVEALQKSNKTSDDSTTTETSAPSTEKPSSSSIANYKVAPANPRYIDIPKLGVHARVLSMGVDANNVLEAPRGIHDAGWYNGSAKPGEAGAMLVDGHSGIGKTHGIFHFLGKLSGGDQIVITRGDNQKFTYIVVKTSVVNSDAVDMSSMMQSADTSKPGLNLISCTGEWIPGTTSLKQRSLVYAVLQT